MLSILCGAALESKRSQKLSAAAPWLRRFCSVTYLAHCSHRHQLRGGYFNLNTFEK